MKWFKRAFLAALVAFSALYVIAIAKGSPNFYKELWAKKTQPKTAETDPKETPKPTPEPEPQPEALEGKLLFLVMGIDGKDVHSQKAKTQRTDTMIITAMDFDTGTIKMLNVPRDTMVKIRGSQQKLNAAFQQGGPETTMKAITELTGIALDKYVLVDYAVVETLVDAIGGIDYNIPWDMRWSDPTADPPLEINFKKGPTHIDGPRAIEFLRWRKNIPGVSMGESDGSDIYRIQNQQAFLKAVLKKAVSGSNLLKLPLIANELLSHIDTNIDVSTILKAAVGARKIRPEAMTGFTLPGSGQYVGGVSYWIEDRAETKKLVQENFSSFLKTPSQPK